MPRRHDGERKEAFPLRLFGRYTRAMSPQRAATPPPVDEPGAAAGSGSGYGGPCPGHVLTHTMIIRDTLVFRTLLAIARQRPDYDELRSHALLELLATADAVRAKVKLRLQEFALSELQFSALVVLLALDPEPVLPTTLATHTSASRATMTDILDHLLTRGYIERQRSKEDRRNYLITLTDAGRTLADRAEAALLQSFAELGRPLTEPAPRALLAICDKLAPRLHFTAAS